MAHSNGHKTADDIVVESGRNWTQWYNELDSPKFRGSSCDEVEDILVYEYGIERNWARRITNRFAAKHSFHSGTEDLPCFEISVRKTFDYPINEVFWNASQWFESEQRATETELLNGNLLTCQWKTDHSKIEVKFHKKGEGKTQMILQHDRIHSRMDAEIMRNFWKESLRGMVEAL
ncbi:MAG: hypothetical protein HQ500_12115 [Flavobacteriales bacterium]|nr:hypothetical protein [Flavobacteriales bacterium]